MASDLFLASNTNKTFFFGIKKLDLYLVYGDLDWE